MTNPPVAFPYSRVFFAFLLIVTFVSALWKYYKYRRRQYYARKRANVNTSASHFDRLPYELVEEIMSYLDLPSLLAAAQVNPQWHNYPCIHSLSSAICNKEFGAKNFLTKDKDIRCPQETSFNVYPSTYKPQWHVEDRYLANRLNKKVLDVAVETALMIGFNMPYRYLNVGNYAVKTSLKWSRENEKYVIFNNASVGRKRKIKIPKTLMNTKNIAEEYDVIADLNDFQFQGITLNKIYRLRGKKLLDWRLGVLMMLALVYGPILVMDIRALLQCYPNSAPYLYLLGVLTSYTLIALFCWFFVKSIREQSLFFKVGSTTLVGSLLSVYIWLAGQYPNYWRNNGLCWIIGGCIEGYEWLFEAFWFRRHHFGLKIATAMTTAITILFVYAIDWSLAIEYIVTNRIWMTMFINLFQILTVRIQYYTAQLTVEDIIDNHNPYWHTFFDTLNRKLLQRGIAAQMLIAVLCSLFAPEGLEFP